MKTVLPDLLPSNTRPIRRTSLAWLRIESQAWRLLKKCHERRQKPARPDGKRGHRIMKAANSGQVSRRTRSVRQTLRHLLERIGRCVRQVAYSARSISCLLAVCRHWNPVFAHPNTGRIDAAQPRPFVAKLNAGRFAWKVPAASFRSLQNATWPISPGAFSANLKSSLMRSILPTMEALNRRFATLSDSAKGKVNRVTDQAGLRCLSPRRHKDGIAFRNAGIHPAAETDFRKPTLPFTSVDRLQRNAVTVHKKGEAASESPRPP